MAFLIKRLPEERFKDREFIENIHGIELSKFNDYNSYLKAGCKSVWATFRACHIVACAVLSAVLKIVEEGKEDQIENKELKRLMSSPNPHDSWKEMIYQWVFHMKLTGGAYWVKDQCNVFGQPLYLYPLLPQYMKLIKGKDVPISSYVYEVNGRKVIYKPEEIIYFRRPHPMNLLTGLGDIEPSESLYNNFINRNRYDDKFLENGAQPSGILTYKGTTNNPVDATAVLDENWGVLKKEWMKQYGGYRNAGKTAFLTGDWTYQRLGLTHEEMSSMEREKTTIQQIFINHGVPLSVAGIEKSTSLATARQDEINFRKYEVVPLLNLFIGKLNTDDGFIKQFDENWEVQYELSGLIDVEQVWKDFGNLLLNGGMTLNEMRKQMGLPKSKNEDLDTYYINSGRTTLDSIGGNLFNDIDLFGITAAGQVAPMNGVTPNTDDRTIRGLQ